MTNEVVNPEAPVTAPENVAAPVEEVQVELDIGVDGEGEGSGGEPLIEAPEGQAVQYSKTGDPGLDMALGFIGKLGIGPDHPAVKAAQSGDFTFIKAELASRGEKATGWEQFVALAERSYESTVKQAQESAAKTRALVEDAVGGAENWKEIQAWAKQNADPAERAQINSMLNQGGIAARAAAKLLGELYAQQAAVKEPANAASNVRSKAAASNGALSPAEYQTELKALVAKIGAHRVGDSAEYQQLQQRRRAFRG